VIGKKVQSTKIKHEKVLIRVQVQINSGRNACRRLWKKSAKISFANF